MARAEVPDDTLLMATFRCILSTNDDADEDLDENVDATHEKQAANMFRLRVQGMGCGPGNIHVFSPDGTFTVFGWDLNVIRSEKPPRE